MADLATEKCVPCEGGTVPLSHDEAEELTFIVPSWQLAGDGKSIARDLSFEDFKQAMGFLQRLAAVADDEGHHPDFCLHGWNKVQVTLRTHAIGGLSRNDFIVAAKLDEVVQPPAA